MGRNICLIIIYGIIIFLGINIFNESEKTDENFKKTEKVTIAKTTETKQEELPEVVEVASKPIAIYFYTSWCPACRNFTPYWDKAVVLNNARFRCVKINVEEAKYAKIAHEFNIRSVPHVYIYDKAKSKKIEIKDLQHITDELEKYYVQNY